MLLSQRTQTSTRWLTRATISVWTIESKWIRYFRTSLFVHTMLKWWQAQQGRWRPATADKRKGGGKVLRWEASLLRNCISTLLACLRPIHSLSTQPTFSPRNPANRPQKAKSWMKNNCKVDHFQIMTNNSICRIVILTQFVTAWLAGVI